MLRLKEILKQKGCTGKELASEVGVSQMAISNIVNGTSFPKPELMREIARVLDVDIRELFIPTKDNKRETIYIKRGDVYIPIGEFDSKGILK